jgi:uroporphyrinogen decarboxylase
VPVDFGAHRSSGISAIAYAKLKKHLGIDSGDIYVYDMVQQLAVIEPEVLDRFQVDTIEMGRGFLTDPADWKPWRLPDGTSCKIPAYQRIEDVDGDWYLLADDGTRLGVQRKGCLYFEQCYWPWEGRPVSEVDLDELPHVLGRSVWTGVAAPGAHLRMSAEGLAALAEGACSAGTCSKSPSSCSGWTPTSCRWQPSRTRAGSCRSGSATCTWPTSKNGSAPWGPIST